MSGFISEFFGYRAEDKSTKALKAAASKNCPFLGSFCTKILARSKEIAGVCTIRQKTEGSPDVICCPIRLYAEEYDLSFASSDCYAENCGKAEKFGNFPRVSAFPHQFPK